MIIDKLLTAPGADRYKKLLEEEAALSETPAPGAEAEEEYNKRWNEYREKYNLSPRGLMASEEARSHLEYNYMQAHTGKKEELDADIAEILAALERDDIDMPTSGDFIAEARAAQKKASADYLKITNGINDTIAEVEALIKQREAEQALDGEPSSEELKQKADTIAQAKAMLEDLKVNMIRAEEQAADKLARATARLNARLEAAAGSAFSAVVNAIHPMLISYIHSGYDIKPVFDKVAAKVEELGLEIPQALKEKFTETDMIFLNGYYNNRMQNFTSSGLSGKYGIVRAPYRTRARAGDTAATPDKLAFVTLKGYDAALSLEERGNAYMMAVSPVEAEKIRFDPSTATLYFEGSRQLSEAKLKELKKNADITDIDIEGLKVFFSYKLFELIRTGTLSPVMTVHIPELLRFTGRGSNTTGIQATAVIEKIKSYHNIYGSMKTRTDGRYKNLPILLYEGNNEEKNTVSFSSPYFDSLIKEIYDITILTDKKGQPLLDGAGDPKRSAGFGYVDPAISSERDKLAAGIVFSVVAQIEQAGPGGTPKVKASTLIERSPQLKASYQASKNKNQYLKRKFSKAWELLRKYSYLEEKYINIQLPNPQDPANIPTPSNLHSLVFTFPHEGTKDHPKKPVKGN